MRIISGTARGTKLFTLEGQTTRPTLDRVKESIFNIIQSQIINSNFLDVFSGSGAIGLEAASRGAKKVILCDKSKDAINIINKNIEKTHLKEKIELYNLDYETLLKNKIVNDLCVNSELSNIPNSQFIDLYIDGNYVGNYLLCDKIEIGKRKSKLE